MDFIHLVFIVNSTSSLSITNFSKGEQLMFDELLMVLFYLLIKSQALVEIIQNKQIREMKILYLNLSNNYF